MSTENQQNSTQAEATEPGWDNWLQELRTIAKENGWTESDLDNPEDFRIFFPDYTPQQALAELCSYGD